jgi:hypothetical protein
MAGSVHVGFVVDKVAQGKVFWVLWLFRQDHSFPHSHSTWEMSNRTICGHSSETQSHLIDMNNNNLQMLNINLENQCLHRDLKHFPVPLTETIISGEIRQLKFQSHHLPPLNAFYKNYAIIYSSVYQLKLQVEIFILFLICPTLTIFNISSLQVYLPKCSAQGF